MNDHTNLARHLINMGEEYLSKYLTTVDEEGEKLLTDLAAQSAALDEALEALEPFAKAAKTYADYSSHEYIDTFEEIQIKQLERAERAAAVIAKHKKGVTHDAKRNPASAAASACAWLDERKTRHI